MLIKDAVGKIYRKLKANHWIYLMLHIILLLIGLLLITYGSSKKTLVIRTTFIGIGASIVATAMAGLVLFLHVWLSQNEFHLLEIIRKFGFINVFENRSIRIKSEYDNRLSNASNAIDIMGFGLKALREDYLRDFKIWADKAKVRILLIDPEFPTKKYLYANQRDKEENNKIGGIKDDVLSFIKDCTNLLLDRRNNFNIRLYRCLPSINIFRIDDNIFWGPYLIGDVSRNFPTFLLDQQGIIFHKILGHFDQIWTNDDFSREVPVEWLKSDGKKNEN